MRSSRFLVVLALFLLLLVGCAGEGDAPQPEEASAVEPVASPTPVTPEATATVTLTPSATATPTPSPTPTPAYETLRLSVDEALAAFGEAAMEELAALDLRDQGYVVEMVPEGEADYRLRVATAAEMPAADEAIHPLGLQAYIPVQPFQSLRDEITVDELRQRWTGEAEGGLLLSEEAAALITEVWGPGEAQLVAEDELLPALQADENAVGLLAFDSLAPTFKALKPDGINLLDRHLEIESYPLALGLWLEGDGVAEVGPLLAAPWEGWANRDPERMTELIMTGVTAMCRLTADRMERHGVLYPALVVSDVLRAADITHVSNEVPFIKDCPVNIARGNLTFCSDYPYWEALEAIGTDIVGLSGNHVNDYGYDGARESIAFYRDRGIKIYGGGLNEEEACAPLIMEHNGNRIAFLATLAFQPWYAWATEDQPGACYFYNNKDRLMAKIADLKASPDVDLVSIELQYFETYHPYPTAQQVEEFRELYEAGADIVSGVQSHVPQSWEPYDATSPHGPGIIVYGLGNFFFDQMWSWQTRTGLIARHTIYDGRLLHSEMLTTVLEDYAQPRWATPEERRGILKSVHDAAPPLPTSPRTSPAEQAAPVVGLALQRWLDGNREAAGHFGLREWTDASFDPAPLGATVQRAEWTIEGAEGSPQQVKVRVRLEDLSTLYEGSEHAIDGPRRMEVTVARTYAGWQIRGLRPAP